MKPNIFLVTVDALRSDYIYQRNGDLHPFISTLMENGLVFEKAISPGPNTASSFPALFTDLCLSEVRKNSGIFGEIPSRAVFLAEEFKDRGYYTAGFSNNAHLTRIQGYDRGFDYFFDDLGDSNNNSDEKTTKEKSSNEGLKLKKKIVEYLNDTVDPKFKRGKHIIGPILKLVNERGFVPFQELSEMIKEFLESYSKDKPLFLWTHLMEVHDPYDLPSDIFSKVGEKKIPKWESQWLRHKRHNADDLKGNYLTQKEMDKIKTLYKCGIRDVDNNLKDFFDYLKDNDYLNNKDYFVLTADHGENLGEHDLVTHSYIYNSVLKVPLIVYNSESKGTIDKVFCNSDLGDLLLDISDGADLKEKANEYCGPAISERGGSIFSIQNKDYKIIWEQKKNMKMYFKLKDGYEIEEVSSDNEVIKSLDFLLENHVKKLQDKEKERLSENIKKSVSDII